VIEVIIFLILVKIDDIWKYEKDAR